MNQIDLKLFRMAGPGGCGGGKMASLYKSTVVLPPKDGGFHGQFVLSDKIQIF